MIPSKTIEIVGAHNIKHLTAKFEPDADYVLLGRDLNDLRVLFARLDARMVDANELRDWQNRLELMLSRVERIY